ncbi:MAG: hypothetical protein K1Y36_16030 [Blastocatellia bacterium]|nr:hypothetical protein [Blastocatellia bacterium]
MSYRRRLPKVEEVPLSEQLIQALQSHFGRIEGWLIKRIKALQPEKLEELLDLVPMAENLDYFVNRIPQTEEKKPVKSHRGTGFNANQSGEDSFPARSITPAPPRIPNDPAQLEMAIEILANWREASADRNVCFRLKGILARFPQNVPEAAQWLQVLRAHRERLESPKLKPQPLPGGFDGSGEEPGTSETAPPEPLLDQSPFGSELTQSAPGLDGPAEFPVENVVSMTIPEVRSTPARGNEESVVELQPRNAVGTVQPAPRMELPTRAAGRDLHRLTFSIPTTPAVEIGLLIKLNQEDPAGNGRRVVSILVDVPADEFSHALVESKRGHMQSLAERVQHLLEVFFKDAEGKAASEAAPPAEPETQLTPPPTVAPPPPAAPIEAQPEPAQPAPAPAAVPHPMESILVRTASFSRNFIAVTDMVKSEFGSIGKLFDEKAQKWISNGRLQNSIPQVESMRLFLATMLKQPATFVQKAWPTIEHLVEDYRIIRSETEKTREQWRDVNQLFGELKKLAGI